MIVWILGIAVIVGAYFAAKHWRGGLWDFIVRARTWLLGLAGAVALILPELMLVLPDILKSPEVMAVMSPEVRVWTGIASLVLVVWSRPRMASRPADVEVKVKEAVKSIPGATIEVKAAGLTKAVVR